MDEKKCPKKCKKNRITLVPPQRMDVQSCAKKEKKLKPCFAEEMSKQETDEECGSPWFCLDKVKYPQTSESHEDNPGVQSCKKKSRQKLACSAEEQSAMSEEGCLSPSLCYEKIKNPEKPLGGKKK